MDGSHALVECLRHEGVKYAFGIPGHSVMGFYDALNDYPEITYIFPRHEETAIFAAGACSRVRGYEPVVVPAEIGPGVAHLVNGVAAAYYEGWPIIVIGGQFYSELLGKGGLQESSQVEYMQPITKLSQRIVRAVTIPETIRKSITVATTGMPGPAYLDVPIDMQYEACDASGYLPSVRCHSSGNPDDIRKAGELLLDAEYPMIHSGGGCIISGASDEVRELAELLGAAVITTMTGKGAISEEHSLSFGLGGFPCGMLGSKRAKQVASKADVLLAIGVRFTELTTSQWSYPSSGTKIIQININPAEIGRNFPVAVGIAGDAKLVLRQLLDFIRKAIGDRDYRTLPRVKEIVGIQKEYWSEVSPMLNSEEVPIHPARVIKEVNGTINKTAIATSDGGHTGNFAAIFFKSHHANALIRMGWFASMAFGLPAAIGAKVAAPERQVVAFLGDGSLVMNPDIETVKRYNLGITFIIFHNQMNAAIKLAQLRKWKRAIGSDGPVDRCPDFVKLAEAYGCVGMRVEKPTEIRETLIKAYKNAEEGVPVFIDTMVGAYPPPRTGRFIYTDKIDVSLKGGYIYTPLL